ncbi:Glycosyltransferase 8 domain-containing protein 2 [Pitangus sulphuratus]|nr:Glycosyltransferase 8 domain-containing protein 2 [Pitangus sulphuratus]
MGAAVAAISSIHSNTEASVLFYIVGLKTTIPHIRYIPAFLCFMLKLGPGDIQELYDTKLAPGHAAAFSDDCDLPSTHEMIRSVGMQNTYMGFLDYRKQAIRDLGISPSTCSFNPGVIVANMTEWKRQRITKQLEKWMQRNVEENLYSSTLGGGVATSPMLIVFHGKYSSINPMWHIRHLGWSPDARYSEQFLQEAKLLHWNGRYKPWDYPSVHTDLWENWFIPDPSGKFKLTRPDS